MRNFIDIINSAEKTALTESKLTPELKSKREEIAQAIAREHPDYSMGKKMAIATSAAKKALHEDEGPSMDDLKAEIKRLRDALQEIADSDDSNQIAKDALASGSELMECDHEIDEDVSYSAKDAHAGKDIGKHGKNFEKIAKKAAEEYGSKEAGERVAGAVLKKLRRK